ncbi:TonB-dependent receptor [Niabella ginsengisoli]|uniref:TonB-dependent receptor n=1 Tax=Niabella ginsengisoli TaxID=522298 RepID=A0ABS9SQA3_9BACT|nr:TonB-dependent receptor [Niabella ginsengisoli]MCH5600426.1 TonB-dependent receptor [Niabella ginsengisoli]
MKTISTKLRLTLIFFSFPFILKAQLAGRVVNENNDALPGASVLIKGTSQGVTTDTSGIFTLSPVPKTPFTISVSSVNYSPRNIVVRSVEDTLLIRLQVIYQTDTVVITSRRRRELSQDVPIAVSVVGANQIAQTGAFNVNRVKELVPSLQLYTSNPRNTGINIRGLGSPFGLTNDGLDPGVGYYVDGVYYARPAVATLDFIDIERFEVLRGPQGTLFGKNTTSGAINITTKKPSFVPGGNLEVSYGNFGYIQAKASVTGPLTKRLAARVSFSGTQRDGVVKNVRTDKYTNDINNLGLRAQFLYNVSDNTQVTLAGDYNKQNPDGYAQVVAGVVQTQRPAYRQFPAIIADLNYTLPSTNAFDRVIDHDTPWNSGNEIGGGSLNIDSKIGPGTLTATTAYRYWIWEPSNDRDFTGLQALAKSQNPSKHKSISQEIRYAGEISERLSGVIGVYYIGQEVKTTGTEESGRDQWRFSQSSTSELWKTPGLFEGYGIKTNSSINSLSAAVFANVDWEVVKNLHLLPGVRLNYDEKTVSYNRAIYGGLETTDPALLALKRGVYSDQFYEADAYERNATYQVTLAYRPSRRINTFGTYSTSYKPVGVNVAGLPTVNNEPAIDLAVIRPEYTKHYEVGIKTTPTDDITFNITAHNSDIEDYQTNVQSAELGVNRGYIANADKVRVRGVEVDATYRLNHHFNFYGALSYTEGKYVKFTNAPLPLEETGATNSEGVQVAFKDISGGALPGISKWGGSAGGEYSTPSSLFGRANRFFIGLDAFARSSFSSSPSPSAYLNVAGYGLFNARLGFRAIKGFSAFIWSRNIFDKDYYEQLLPAGGNAGHYAGVLGDPRTYGLTLSYTFNGRN